MSKTGKDNLITKGLISGITMGSLVTFVIGAIPKNKVRPKDAASSLSYMASHAIYGVVATSVAAKLGHPSLYDVKPQNNYLNPTEATSEQVKIKAVEGG